MYDLQKANMWKRISAALFDVIILAVAVVGVALLLSTALNYDGHLEKMKDLATDYMVEYGIDPDMTKEQLEALSEDEQKAYENKRLKADEAYRKDPEVIRVYNILLNLAMIIVTFSVLISFALLEFLIPLLLGNGQTLGKKIFGVALMRIDGVKISPMLLFARSILGKCTIGTLVPIFLIIMILFRIAGIFVVVLLGVLVIIQTVMFLGTKNHTPIHDKLAQTVTVDMASQLIFDSPEAMLEYKKRIHAEDAQKRER